MVSLQMEFRFIRPDTGIFCNLKNDSLSMPSQLSTGAAREGSPYLCSGWWSRLTGQMFFKDHTITLVQETRGGDIFIEGMQGISDDGHTICFARSVLKNHKGKGFMTAIQKRMDSLWSDSSEKPK